MGNVAKFAGNVGGAGPWGWGGGGCNAVAGGVVPAAVVVLFDGSATEPGATCL